MKNEKLVFDIGTFENIVIVKLIDVPSCSYSANTNEEFDLIDREKATIRIKSDILEENRQMIFDYKYSNDTGDNWEITIPDSTKAVDVKAKALSFSDTFKAAQFVKCFKATVQKINSKFATPVSKKYVIEWERYE